LKDFIIETLDNSQTVWA